MLRAEWPKAPAVWGARWSGSAPGLRRAHHGCSSRAARGRAADSGRRHGRARVRLLARDMLPTALRLCRVILPMRSIETPIGLKLGLGQYASVGRELEALIAVEIVATGFAGLRFVRQNQQHMTEDYIKTYDPDRAVWCPAAASFFKATWSRRPRRLRQRAKRGADLFLPPARTVQRGVRERGSGFPE